MRTTEKAAPAQQSPLLRSRAEVVAKLRRRANTAALALGVLWLIVVAFTLTPDVDDFKWYWQGARSLLQTGDPYQLRHDPAAGATSADNEILYSYPPPFAYLMLPFGLVSYRAGQWSWFGVNLLLLAALLRLCVGLSESALARRWWGVVALLALLASPTRLSLQLGQISLMVSVMLVGCLALERRPAVPGVLLGLACWFKLTPALLAPRYLLRPPRRVLWWACGTAALVLVITLLLSGPRPYTSFVEQVVLGRTYPYAAEHNISLYGFWARLLTKTPYGVALADAPGLARALVLVSSAVVLVVCLRAGRGPADPHGARLQHSLWLCAMLLLSPANGYYNLVLLLFPLLVLLRELELRPDRRLRNRLLLATALVCIPPAWTDGVAPLYRSLHIGWGLLLLTPSLYGLLLYIWLLARVTIRG